MRTPRRPENSLRAPLNRILGTETNVRLLRALVRADTPLAAGELARRASLGRTSVYPALDALESTGVVEFTGTGAQRHIRFRTKHPLARALTGLFAAEAGRVEGLIAALRDAFKDMAPRPTSAWVEGLGGADVGEDTLRVFVLGNPKVLPRMTDYLGERAVSIEREFGVELEIRGVSRSELEASGRNTEALTQVILLDGVPPAALIASSSVGPRASAKRSVSSHADHDARARRLAVAVAAKLERDPGLVRVARRQVAERAKEASPQERRELQEWARVLSTMSPGRLQRFLVESSERATRLRQTLPALGLLTPAERNAVLASVSDEEARAAVSGR